MLGRNWTRFAVVAALSAAFAVIVIAPSSAGGEVIEFADGITAGSQPFNIAAGPDGNIWFTEPGGNRIGRITPSGVVTEFSTGISPNAVPYDIVAGPDGNVWFTEFAGGRIGRITPAGDVTEFSTGIGAFAIAAGVDGNLYFSGGAGFAQIGRITTLGVVTILPPMISSLVRALTTGPDGNLWFTEINGRVGRMTTDGTLTEFTGPTSSCCPGPGDITAGPDGNLWFAETTGAFIGRLATDGTITEFPVGILGPEFKVGLLGSTGITSGPDGNLWFTAGAAIIRRITPDGVISVCETGFTAGGTAITTGSDGNLWFAQFDADSIGTTTTSCAASAVTAQPRFTG